MVGGLLSVVLLALVGLVACQTSPLGAASPRGAPATGVAAPAPTSGARGPAAPAPGSSGQPEADGPPLGVVVAHAGVTPNVATVWVAADLDFDRQYGLEITIQRTRSAAMSQAALLAGEIDYAWTGLPPFLSARAGGSDVVFIGATTNRAATELVVRPPLSTPEDLRGKTFGVQSFGGPPHIRTLTALRRLGLDPERDGISIIITGDEATTTAALLEGAIDGAAISYTAAMEPKARGFHSWDLAPLGIAEITGIVARPGLLREKPEETRRLLRALAASNAYIRSIGTDDEARRRVGQVVANHLRTAPDSVLAQLDLVKDYLPVDLRIELSEAREQQAMTAVVSPEVQDQRVEDWLDQSFLDQLQREGFFDRLVRR